MTLALSLQAIIDLSNDHLRQVMKDRIILLLLVCLIALVAGCGGDNSTTTSFPVGSFNPVDDFSDFALTPRDCLPTATTGTIKGTVTEAVQGFVIPDARVTTGQGGSSPAVTDEQGVYTLCDLPPGTYRVSVTAIGFDTSSASSRDNVAVQAGAASEGIDLQLTLSSQQPPSNVGGISGRVVNGQSPGQGIQGVHVEAWVNTTINNGQIVSGQIVDQTLTDGQGGFFLSLSIGAYTLAVHKDGFIPDPKLIVGAVIRSDSVTTLQKDISLYPQ
jgi:hypothetical protein